MMFRSRMKFVPHSHVKLTDSGSRGLSSRASINKDGASFARNVVVLINGNSCHDFEQLDHRAASLGQTEKTITYVGAESKLWLIRVPFHSFSQLLPFIANENVQQFFCFRSLPFPSTNRIFLYFHIRHLEKDTHALLAPGDFSSRNEVRSHFT